MPRKKELGSHTMAATVWLPRRLYLKIIALATGEGLAVSAFLRRLIFYALKEKYGVDPLEYVEG